MLVSVLRWAAAAFSKVLDWTYLFEQEFARYCGEKKSFDLVDRSSRVLSSTHLQFDTKTPTKES